jgi:[acyl-carrier-protein] S-malonyltransferase
MGKIAFCFPGQGSQEVGMGAAMAATYPSARAVFDTAADALGFDLAAICFDGPLEALSATDVTQPALLAASLASLAAVTDAGVVADLAVGHSVGEYGALVAAGVVAPADAFRLVRARGIATAEAAEAAPGAMAAILGLDDARVEELCAAIDGVWAANYNCPGQLVVSGTGPGVDALIAAATEAGARRAMRLNVAGGFHSPLTATAATTLAPAIAATTFSTPTIGFFSTTTCAYEDPTTIPDVLVRQLSAPVRFTQSVQALVADGVTLFVELGAGSVLSGLVKRIDRSVQAVSVSTPEQVGRLLEVIRG